MPDKCEHHRTGTTYAERDRGQPLYHKEVIICLDCGEILGDASEEFEIDRRVRETERRIEMYAKIKYK